MGAFNQSWKENGTAFSFSDTDECGGSTVVHHPPDRVRVMDGEWRRVVGTHLDPCMERMEQTRTVQSALDRPVSRHGYKHEDANLKITNDAFNLRWNLSYHLWQRGWPTKFAKEWHQREEDGGEGKEVRRSMCQALLFVASADQARAASKAKEDEWKRASETIKRERAQAHATRVSHFVTGNNDFQHFYCVIKSR
jgi:hypothetical protein